MAIIDFVFRRRRATAEQIRRRFFSIGATSRMRHRLAVLLRERYLDRARSRSVTEHIVYRVGAGAPRGLAILREQYGDAQVRARVSAMCQDEHFELITECYVLVWQAVSTAGWELTAWEDAIDLRPRTESDGLVPDAFFCVQRPDGTKASFFLELERAAKSDQSMRRKLEKHVRFFRSGRYEEVFGLRSLRVLFVMVSSQKPRVDPAARIGRLAEQIGATFVCSTTLSSLRAGDATDLLFGDKWWRPGAGDGYRLFEWRRE